MPIFEQTYRKWEGSLRTTGIRWLPITIMGIRQTFKKKRFLLFFIGCLIPFLVYAIMMVIRAIAPQNIEMESDFMQIGPTFFAHFLLVQSGLVFIMTIWSGANLINSDYQTNALQLYLSKPLTPRDYILGKLSIVAFFILIITAVPALILFLLRLLIMYENSWVLGNMWVLLSIVGFSIIIAAVHSLLILFLSAVTSNSRFSGIAYFLIIFFTDGVSDVLYGMTRSDLMYNLSLSKNIQFQLKLLFGNYYKSIPGHPEHCESPLLAFAILLAVCALCYSILRKKVGRIEVIQ